MFEFLWGLRSLDRSMNGEYSCTLLSSLLGAAPWSVALRGEFSLGVPWSLSSLVVSLNDGLLFSFLILMPKTAILSAKAALILEFITNHSDVCYVVRQMNQKKKKKIFRDHKAQKGKTKP
mmetsp:Transcript_16303/g.21125  ORF Transcript_16303/g.21125 Transcript_16303/m.21125 type:complete len:120 (+) Transcript_16303:165-524(+)